MNVSVGKWYAFEKPDGGTVIAKVINKDDNGWITVKDRVGSIMSLNLNQIVSISDERDFG
jgi:hypothetical protein